MLPVSRHIQALWSNGSLTLTKSNALRSSRASTATIFVEIMAPLTNPSQHAAASPNPAEPAAASIRQWSGRVPAPSRCRQSRESPAQFDGSRQLSLFIEDGAACSSIGIGDDEHPLRMAM